ncbi:MAG TPA: hypothetical protein VFG83_04370 [Kofleriaceae bacterium]|nr:hypothetical protein [Kofleriaceae bacterium]
MTRSCFSLTAHFLTAVVFVAAVAACGGRSGAWDRERLVLGPIPLKNQVAYVDSARDEVIVVDVQDPGAPVVRTYAIGRRAIYAVPTPDREHLAVITRGQEAYYEGEIDEAPALWLIDTADPAATPVAYAIGSPFDRLAIADPAGDAGPIAVAYFSASGPDSDGFFRNPNELAVIDLARPAADDNPVIKTVRSFGAAPSGVVLSPPMVLPGAADPTPRIFALILAVNTVTIIDVTHPERDEVSVRLGTGGTGVTPREVVFAPQTATAYLRSDGASDVLEILLSYEAPATENATDNDYQPALAELGANSTPTDIAVYDDPTGRRLILAATASPSQLVVIDADSGQFRAIPTPAPMNRVLLFPQGGDIAPRMAILTHLGSPVAYRLPLSGITEDLTPARLEPVAVDKPILDIVPVPGQDRAMIVHDDNREVLSLLDVGIGSVSPLEGIGRLDSYAFAADGSQLIGITDGFGRVGFLDLDNLHPSDMRLDDPPVQVFAMPNGAVFIDHGDSLGLATVLPSTAADRSEAVVLSGFLLAEILDEGR